MPPSEPQDARTAPEVQTLLARIPLLAGATNLHVAPLQGVVSLNNAVCRVTVGPNAYLLRVASQTASLLGIRRSEERAAAQAAAQAGVGPEILYADDAGNLLMPFLVGRHWQPDEFHDPANMARLMHTLRRLHEVKKVPAEGCVYRRVERLLDSARVLSLPLPPGLDAHLDTMRHIEAERKADTRFRPGLSHNDFWANNFLDDGQNLWLVDWEFAGDGDGLYDLATLAMAGKYSEAEQIALLHAYGYTHPGDYQQLQSMKTIVRLFESAWALVMHGLRGSEHYDYLGQSHKMFQMLNA